MLFGQNHTEFRRITDAFDILTVIHPGPFSDSLDDQLIPFQAVLVLGSQYLSFIIVEDLSGGISEFDHVFMLRQCVFAVFCRA